MRYKVKAPNEAVFETVKKRLAEKIPIFVESKKRLMLSVGDLPEAVISELEEEGSRVTVDHQYELD